jgi:hypothetical protein
MSSHSEDFHKLRLLLKLKQHEEPPPGYFDRFSRDVMARIKAGETGDEIAGDLPWFQRALGLFELKPVFAGAFGMAVCALLISGVVSSESVPGPAVAVNSGDSSQPSFVRDVSPPTPALQAVLTDSNANHVVSSLFDQYQSQQIPTKTVDYWIRDNN